MPWRWPRRPTTYRPSTLDRAKSITTEPFVERKQLLLEHLGMTLPPREAVP
jgi:hypothetical protein